MKTKSANGHAIMIAVVIGCFIIATIVISYMATHK